jgi:hypothetical protein
MLWVLRTSPNPLTVDQTGVLTVTQERSGFLWFEGDNGILTLYLMEHDFPMEDRKGVVLSTEKGQN